MILERYFFHFIDIFTILDNSLYVCYLVFFQIMAFYDEPQWAVVGDTFPVGCAPQESIVYGKQSFKANPDMENEKYK